MRIHLLNWNVHWQKVGFQFSCSPMTSQQIKNLFACRVLTSLLNAATMVAQMYKIGHIHHPWDRPIWQSTLGRLDFYQLDFATQTWGPSCTGWIGLCHIQSNPYKMFVAYFQPSWPSRPKTKGLLLFYFLKLYNFGFYEIFVGSTGSELHFSVFSTSWKIDWSYFFSLPPENFYDIWPQTYENFIKINKTFTT